MACRDMGGSLADREYFERGRQSRTRFRGDQGEKRWERPLNDHGHSRKRAFVLLILLPRACSEGGKLTEK